jgi:hypothetical protein
MDLRRQAQRGYAAGMSEEETESEIAAYLAGKKFSIMVYAVIDTMSSSPR